MGKRQYQAVLTLSRVSHCFQQGQDTVRVLRGVDLTLTAGEIVALIGPSGTGKSTLLQICGLLESPDSGEIVIDGVVCTGAADATRTKLRRMFLGFVYQHHHLLADFSAEENVMIPQMIARSSRQAARKRARELLEKTGLGHRLDHRPGSLSGGERQRVAICRALANRPKLLLADEPTGNLDPDASQAVLNQLLRLARDEGLAALIATHNHDLAQKTDRMIGLERGALVLAS